MTPHLNPGNADSLRIAECSHCFGTLYAGQPMRLGHHQAGVTLDRSPACRPANGCATDLREAMHVACSVHLERI